MSVRKSKNIPTLIAAVVFLAVFFFMGIAIATNGFQQSGCSTASSNPYESVYVDNDMRISDLSVTIDASAGDRSMRITEDYTFEIDVPSHGFYRDIAVNSGEKIRDLKVYNAGHFYNAYELSAEGHGILRVRVGSENGTVSGKGIKCTIEYTMITPAHAVYPDALVVNAIGHGWNCKILNARVKVKLPCETSAAPEYYYGKWGDTNMLDEKPESGKSEYEVTLSDISAYHGLTLYYFLPEGALSAYTDFDFVPVLIAGLIIVCVAVVLKLTVFKNKQLTPITNYYPPKHSGASIPMDPVDMGYLIDNKCQGSDVTSLIFYFASQGYIRVIEPNSEDNTSDSFKLEKLKGLPKSMPSWQHDFFNKLFERGDKVVASELSYRAYTAVSAVQSKITSRYKDKLYDKKSQIAAVVTGVLTALYATIIVLTSCLKVGAGFMNWLGFVSVFPVAFTGLAGTLVVYNRHKLRGAKRVLSVIGFIALGIVSSLLLLAVTYSMASSLAARLLLAGFVAAGSILAPLLYKRTEYYDEELNEVLGFKDFLLTAEKDRLETLLEENPQYYYDVLPYANVLGVSDIWQDKFKELTLQPPRYYSGSTVFDILVFNSYYRRSYRTYSEASVLRPSSSSSRSGGGHFGGGGGHSGGGFGGGGGGRW